MNKYLHITVYNHIIKDHNNNDHPHKRYNSVLLGLFNIIGAINNVAIQNIKRYQTTKNNITPIIIIKILANINNAFII